MRLFSFTMMIALALPLVGASSRGQCKQSCGRDYDLCLKRATTRAARKTCVVFRKTCNRGCPAQ